MNSVSGALPGRGYAHPTAGEGPSSPSAGPSGGDGNSARPYFVDSYGNAPPYLPSGELARLLSGLPMGARVFFTPEQLAALDVAIVRTRQRPNTHKIDYRVSVPLFGRRYYFVLLAGKERRTLARIRSEGHTETWRLTLAYAILMSAIVMGGIVAILALLYVVKSMVGIDFFDQHSVLHDLLY